MANESPLEYYVKKAQELGLSINDLKHASPIVYGADEPSGFRNKKTYVSIDNKKKMILRVTIKGSIDPRRDCEGIVGWGAVDEEYEFSITCDSSSNSKYVLKSFVVSDGVIVKNRNAKSKLFDVGSDYHP